MVDLEVLTIDTEVQILRKGSQNSLYGVVVDITDDKDYPIEVKYYLKRYNEYEEDCFKPEELDEVKWEYDFNDCPEERDYYHERKEREWEDRNS